MMKISILVKEENNKTIYYIECPKCKRIFESELKNQVKIDYGIHKLRC